MISITKSAIKAMKVRMGSVFIVMFHGCSFPSVVFFQNTIPDFVLLTVDRVEPDLSVFSLACVCFSVVQARGPDCGEIYQKSKSGHSLITY